MTSASFLDTTRQEPEKTAALERIETFNEIYAAFEAKQAQAQAARCLDCGIPYCKWQCPVANHIPEWLRLVKEGRLFEAADLSNETNTLPEICGRVCPQDRLCEDACTLNTGFEAVTIGQLEKYISDEAIKQGWRPRLTPVRQTQKRVAVLGAGPAGLGCADILTRNGLGATVFDQQPEIGGLLTFGIPPFKLEKAVVQQRRELLEAQGVRFELGCQVGRDVAFEALLAQYDAVFLGLGTYKPVTGGLLEGFTTVPEGVTLALPYLIGNVNHVMGWSQQLPMPYRNVAGQRVVVLGGGDTAMDCTRTALRQGAASVTCVYRRNEANMPGSRREVQHAKEEGAHFIFQQQPLSLVCTEGHLTGVQLQATQPLEPALRGRQRFTAVPGTETVLEADVVVLAFGFQPNPPTWLTAHGIELDTQGRVKVNAQGQTTHPQVYAGGDMVRGADLVVRAIFDGRQAAEHLVEALVPALPCSAE